MAIPRPSAFAFCILTAIPGFAKEVVVLTSGFEFEALSHTEQNQTLVLSTFTGTVELPASAIERIEQAPDNAVAALSPLASTHLADRPETLLTTAAVAQGLPPEFVQSVARIESGLRQNAVSSKGAVGLMQLMPRTAADLGVDANSAKENAQGGAQYLRSLLLRYHGDAMLALAAYNAGPAAVAKFGGVPPYPETRNYVQRVLRELAREQKSHPGSASRPKRQANSSISTR